MTATSVLGVIALLTGACGRIDFRVHPRDADADSLQGDGLNVTLPDGSRPDIVFTTNVAFVTGPTVMPSALGGLNAADAICQQAANDAQLPGTYVAWLSTASTNAVARLSGSRGWVRTDGLPIADLPSDLASGSIWAPISLAADGSDQGFSSTSVTTGTNASGTVDATCSDWTSATTNGTYGIITSNDASWTTVSASTFGCDTATRIYCFGTGNQTPVTMPPIMGRRAFYSTTVSVGGGVTALDAHCQADADAAGLGATFHALVATAAASALSRFDTSGPRWVRIDGVPLAPTAADLATGFRVPLNTYADGSPYASPFGIAKSWTGATAPDALANGHACSDWTSTAPSGDGDYGRPSNSGPSGFSTGGTGGRRCDESGYGVYCLEL